MLVKKAFNGSKTWILYSLPVNLFVNILYAAGNFALGLWSKSYWFLTMGAYNLILAIMRFSVMTFSRQFKKTASVNFIQGFTGAMIILLGFVLGGSVYLSVKFDVAQSFHEIIMIAIATYTFSKITIAIINYVKKSKENSRIISTLQAITLCDASASVYSMQKSMLVSFDGMTPPDIRLMNILTGIGVVTGVCLLGVSMIIKSKKGD